jgi:hypothetical protein
MWRRLELSHGYLSGPDGYCSDLASTRICHRFPIIVGEFGSNFNVRESTPSSKAAGSPYSAVRKDPNIPLFVRKRTRQSYSFQ